VAGNLPQFPAWWLRVLTPRNLVRLGGGTSYYGFHFVSAVGKNATDQAVAAADWLVRRLDFDSNKDNRKFVPFLSGSFMPVSEALRIMRRAG